MNERAQRPALRPAGGRLVATREAVACLRGSVQVRRGNGSGSAAATHPSDVTMSKQENKLTQRSLHRFPPTPSEQHRPLLGVRYFCGRAGAHRGDTRVRLRPGSFVFQDILDRDKVAERGGLPADREKLNDFSSVYAAISCSVYQWGVPKSMAFDGRSLDQNAKRLALSH